MEVNLLSLWTNFLPIANVIFAIVFVVVIYSTAAGQGLSNYSVKKILPRLIIVAIGVNISYYICALIVDLVNIVAVGVPNLIFSGVLTTESNTASAYSQIQGVLGGILGIVLIFCFGTLALVAMLVTVIALVARQVILSALVVISPIAIVCAVLPATQKWFDKWLKTFVQLLAVYPLFMLVWAAVRWFQTIGATEMMAGRPVLQFIVQSVCTIIPAVVIYPLLKASGGVMGQITGAISKSPLGTQGALGRAAQGRDALRRQEVGAGTHRINRIPGIGGAAMTRQVTDEDGNVVTDDAGNALTETAYRGGLTNFAARRRARTASRRSLAETSEAARNQDYMNRDENMNVRINEAELRKDMAGATKEGIKEGLREGQLRDQTNELMARMQGANASKQQQTRNFSDSVTAEGGAGYLTDLATNRGNVDIDNTELNRRRMRAQATAQDISSQQAEADIKARQTMLSNELSSSRAAGASLNQALQALGRTIDVEDDVAVTALARLNAANGGIGGANNTQLIQDVIRGGNRDAIAALQSEMMSSKDLVSKAWAKKGGDYAAIQNNWETFNEPTADALSQHDANINLMFNGVTAGSDRAGMINKHLANMIADPSVLQGANGLTRTAILDNVNRYANELRLDPTNLNAIRTMLGSTPTPQPTP